MSDLHETVRHALRTAGFIDPDDGTVPMWPNGDDGGPVWVRGSRLVDAVVNNLPIGAVIALHSPAWVDFTGGRKAVLCSHCDTGDPYVTVSMEWPCPTMEALGFTAETAPRPEPEPVRDEWWVPE